MARSIFRLLLLALSLMALCAAQADTVTFPDDLVAIEQGAFMNDASITEVTIPEGCTRIGGYAFSNCAALETVTITNSVGDEVEVVVLSYSVPERHFCLGVKQLTPDPWETVAERFPEGKKVRGEVVDVCA